MKGKEGQSVMMDHAIMRSEADKAIDKLAELNGKMPGRDICRKIMIDFCMNSIDKGLTVLSSVDEEVK